MATKLAAPARYVDHYQLIERLDADRYTEVWAGRDFYLHTPVALKILFLDRLENEQDRAFYAERFREEARALASLNHPHIVRFLNYNRGRNLLFLVMQYAAYGSLAHFHRPGQPLPLPLVRTYITQVGRALQYMHNRGLIHRDVKPGNILLLSRKHVVLADFGLAMPNPEQSYPQRRFRGGTTVYMPIEQQRGYPRPTSDQYALATVAYELLTGYRPFYGTPEEIVAQRERMAPAPMRQLVPELPSALDGVVLMALRRNPARRYPTVLDFVREFDLACTPIQRRLPYYSETRSQVSRASVTRTRPPVYTNTASLHPVSEALPSLSLDEMRLARVPHEF